MRLQSLAKSVSTKWTTRLSNTEALFLFWRFKIFAFQFRSPVALSRPALQSSLQASCFLFFMPASFKSFVSFLFLLHSQESFKLVLLGHRFVIHFLCRLFVKKIQSADENRRSNNCVPASSSPSVWYLLLSAQHRRIRYAMCISLLKFTA